MASGVAFFKPTSLAGTGYHTQKHCALAKPGIHRFMKMRVITENAIWVLASQSWDQGRLFKKEAA